MDLGALAECERSRGGGGDLGDQVLRAGVGAHVDEDVRPGALAANHTGGQGVASRDPAGRVDCQQHVFGAETDADPLACDGLDRQHQHEAGVGGERGASVPAAGDDALVDVLEAERLRDGQHRPAPEHLGGIARRHLAAAVEHHDPLAQQQRLVRVVGDRQDRQVELVSHAQQVAQHPRPQAQVE